MLRGEPFTVASEVPLTPDFEEPVELQEEVPVMASNKAESKNNIMDSGIGLSGMGLSSGMSVDSSMGIEAQPVKREAGNDHYVLIIS